ARTIELLIESPNISRIVFVQQRNYSYSSSETFLLQEIANLYVYLTKQEKILGMISIGIVHLTNYHIHDSYKGCGCKKRKRFIKSINTTTSCKKEAH
ncbi:MAG: hypothetical protein Q7R56_03715, partial [Nanoarchaeota archaeon]|nr:hypothetical protein [Nanoarchaeota archaeon]